jgi:2-succinyl-6-hydroxy-2,4-cyclohexadiene-1-carboxylate synthase
MGCLMIKSTPHHYDLCGPTGADLTLVFIHGWLLSRRYWQPLIQQLSPRYRCLAYDLRGFGESQPCGSQQFSLEDYAMDLGMLLKDLRLGQVWLVGHSLGGAIALWAAKLWPEQVAGVICLNAGGGLYLEQEFKQFRRVGEQLVRLRGTWLRWLPGSAQLFARGSVYHPLGIEWGHQRLLDFLRADRAAAQGSLLASTSPDAVHTLPHLVSQLQQPVYFLGGLQDRVMELRYVRHLASFHRLYPPLASNLIELEGCGHLAMLEQTQQVAHHIQTIVVRMPQVLERVDTLL